MTEIISCPIYFWEHIHIIITSLDYLPTTTEAPTTQTTLDTGSFMFRELSERFK